MKVCWLLGSGFGLRKLRSELPVQMDESVRAVKLRHRKSAYAVFVIELHDEPASVRFRVAIEQRS